LLKAPEGHARLSLRLLETKVVELGIIKRASDMTIQRALKKTPSAAPPPVLGHSAQGERRFRGCDGGRA
jgi:hypothetical protein